MLSHERGANKRRAPKCLKMRVNSFWYPRESNVNGSRGNTLMNARNLTDLPLNSALGLMGACGV